MVIYLRKEQLSLDHKSVTLIISDLPGRTFRIKAQHENKRNDILFKAETIFVIESAADIASVSIGAATSDYCGTIC